MTVVAWARRRASTGTASLPLPRKYAGEGLNAVAIPFS
jgi:hypothetical protein